MKALFIGDIHGLSGWEEIVLDGLTKHYKVIFLGDYVDSFFVPELEIYENLKDIINFKKKHPEVTLLIGNHDYAYMYAKSACSGYNHKMAYSYRELFKNNWDLFDVAWGYTNLATKKYTLATHAGLTNTYWGKFVKSYINNELKHIPITEIYNTMHETLNYLKDRVTLLWKVGSIRGGVGTGGVLWADYSEVINDLYHGINQVFGHTPKSSISVDKFGDDLVVCVDNWGNRQIVSIILDL